MKNSEISIMPSFNISTGNYTICFDMNISSFDSISKMFYGVGKMVSIYFSPKFDIANYSLISVNLFHFNTSSINKEINKKIIL